MNTKIIKSTPFGSVGIIWTRLNDNPKIVRILLTKPGLSAEDQVPELYPNSQASSCAKINDVATAIKGLLEGEKINFSLDIADLSLCTEFQQLVLRAEHGIPRGSISTYQLIAEYLGKKKGARAVGNALANNPFPLIIPCHRAIRSDRRLGGYQGGLEMKRALLEKEGVVFDDAGRAACVRFHYERITSNKMRYAGILDKEENMAYHEGLVQRVREEMSELPGYVEKKMFGGVGFMLHCNMACGVNWEDLIVMVGPERYENTLAEPHTRPFDMTGRPMKGWVVVIAEGYKADRDLKSWVQQGVGYAMSLPAK